MCSPMNTNNVTLSNRSKECKIGMLSHINLINLLDDSVNTNVELFEEDQINKYIKVIESTSKIYELCNDNQSNIDFLVSYCLLLLLWTRLFISSHTPFYYFRHFSFIMYIFSFCLTCGLRKKKNK